MLYIPEAIVALTGKQQEQLQKALLSAFPSQLALAQMVSFELNQNLNVIAGGNNLSEVVFTLMQWAEAHGKLDELVIGARYANPGNVALRLGAEELKLAPSSPPQAELEAIVLKSVSFANVEEWRARMSQSELAVCRVEIPVNSGIGTGFLLGPDVAMTNYHVMKDVIEQSTQASSVVLRFDYKTLKDGTTMRKGQEYRFAADWLIDSSPVSDLDFALMRVTGEPGNESVGGQAGAPTRKWLTPKPHTFEAGEPVFIIQHPKTEPLKLASGPFVQAIQGQNRVTYKANTLCGSSGSPCFTSDWDLVVLHQAGDKTKGINTGIPFSAILDRLRQKNLLGILGGESPYSIFPSSDL